jgi:hypothetical protein
MFFPIGMSSNGDSFVSICVICIIWFCPIYPWFMIHHSRGRRGNDVCVYLSWKQRMDEEEKEMTMPTNSVWNYVPLEHTLLEVDSRSWMQTGNQIPDNRRTRPDPCNRHTLLGILCRVVSSFRKCGGSKMQPQQQYEESGGREKRGKMFSLSCGSARESGVNIPSASAPRGQNRSAVLFDRFTW